MTPNRRIFLNIVATYGRSLYALAIGVFTARWALQALGKSDYGLFGLVGGLVWLVAFLNTILASSVGRFYAVSVGEARKGGCKSDGLDNCRRWFNTALSIHTIVPVVLMSIGYPIGVWSIENFLTIPLDRVSACIWVWRFACAAGLISMVNVPFNAMYVAKQEIAELTIYGFICSTANALFLYYMIKHPAVWLPHYAFGTALIGIVPNLIIMVRAMLKYQECRVVISYFYDIEYYKKLFSFVVARFWSEFGSMVFSQGQPVLVNKYMGPIWNASVAVGNSLAGHAMTLATALKSSFWPAIANLSGEDRLSEMERMCFLASRMGTILLLVFAVPLCLEAREVLRIWLVNPPDFSAEICIAVLIRQVFDLMTVGHGLAILSRGIGVMRYSWVIGWAGIVAVLIAWIGFILGFGMWSVVAAFLVSKMIDVGVRIYYGKRLLSFDPMYWVKTVLFPIAMLTLVSFVAGSVICYFVKPSFIRVVMTTCMCEMIILPMAWLMVLNEEERSFIKMRVINKLRWETL